MIKCPEEYLQIAIEQLPEVPSIAVRLCVDKCV